MKTKKQFHFFQSPLSGFWLYKTPQNEKATGVLEAENHLRMQLLHPNI
jgi:hypothetical protein